ncbi:MAG: aldo/keto reductase [Firmicutes bacterium]|nr:aldo/keto reductase [Bacillota bacterium]
MQYVTFNNGLKMPMLGFGVFQVTDHEVCKQSVLDAIEAGYRLIDTAAVYGNERAVGEAVKEAAAKGMVKREELFITSKLWVQDMEYEAAKKGINCSLERLGMEYVDLYLIHQAVGDYFGAWRALEEAYEDGRLKAIGVSNFYPHTLANLCETMKICPAVNQVEIHPFFTQDKAIENMKYYNIIPEAWAPLGGGRYDIFGNEVLKEIAAAHNKTVGQVALRWNVQRGVAVIPKSTHKERIIENFDIFDFELTQDEMAKISALDMGSGGSRTKHLDPEFVRNILKVKVPE